MFVKSAYAQQATDAASHASSNLFNQPLFLIEFILLLLVLLVAPGYAAWRSRSSTDGTLKGLNLPEGSVRAMLALLIVGSFVNVLLFGASVLGDNFEQVITAFGTLAGAVTGFYFAGRKPSEGSNSPPKE
ncbi:MAG: hypothetical protein OXC26_00995 [Albidovulum sp.]|nr:hypothetical protein [Albidovulum sp.]